MREPEMSSERAFIEPDDAIDQQQILRGRGRRFSRPSRITSPSLRTDFAQGRRGPPKARAARACGDGRPAGVACRVRGFRARSAAQRVVAPARAEAGALGQLFRRAPPISPDTFGVAGERAAPVAASLFLQPYDLFVLAFGAGHLIARRGSGFRNNMS